MRGPLPLSSGQPRIESGSRVSVASGVVAGRGAAGIDRGSAQPIHTDEEAVRGSRLQPNVGPGRLVVIEGNNGVGKSAVAAFLAGRLNAATFHFTEAFRRFRLEAAIDRGMAALPRFSYYLSATIELSCLVREELEWRDVVCDRYLPAPLSILVADQAMTYEEALSLTERFEPHLVRPDAILLLTADHATASARLRSRIGPGTPENPIHGQTLESAPFFRRRESILRREGRRIAPLVELDTNGLTPGETLERAWALLSPFLPILVPAAAPLDAEYGGSEPSLAPRKSPTDPSISL
jgi:thymidylate kinase